MSPQPPPRRAVPVSGDPTDLLQVLLFRKVLTCEQVDPLVSAG